MKQNDNIIEKLLEKAICIYHYGSYVYGTFEKDKSDYDYIVIIPNEYKEYDFEQFEQEKNQYSFYTEKSWQNKLDNNDVDAIEMFFLPQQYKIKENKEFYTEIKKEKIRENFSKVASNSYVKCKKKLEVVESYNPRIGKKSLWHSLRILYFGIQVLTNGKISDYTEANYLYEPIVSSDNNKWEYYKITYKPLYNELKTKFRLLG